jgi:hypothetical protein
VYSRGAHSAQGTHGIPVVEEECLSRDALFEPQMAGEERVSVIAETAQKGGDGERPFRTDRVRDEGRWVERREK